MSAAVALSIVVGACASTIRIPDDRLPPPLTAPASALAEPGSDGISVQSDSRLGKYGCTLSYEIYRPLSRDTTAMVMLAHGFMRDLKHMRGWASHWASHGVPVTVMSLCNASWLDGHHHRNAADLAMLAGVLHDGPVLYAGFSAGGLAAYLAAAADPRALAYLGLDAVDSGGLGAAMAGRVRVPALFLLAESSACNAYNNFWGALSAMESFVALRIRGATHCHFENPDDVLCEWACGAVRPERAAATVMATIRTLATAWMLAQILDYPPAVTTLDAARAGRGNWIRRAENLP